MAKENSCWSMCCGSKRFPTIPSILLIVGVLWLLSDLKIITVDIPWWPVILIIVAVGWIANSYSKGK